MNHDKSENNNSCRLGVGDVGSVGGSNGVDGVDIGTMQV
jgi:hypothetical protein